MHAFPLKTLGFSTIVTTLLATAALAAQFTDARDGLVITPPPGFTATPASSDEDAIGVTIERSEDAICLAGLVKHTQSNHPSEAEVMKVQDAFDAVAVLGPALPIRGGPAFGILRSGTSRVAETPTQVRVAVLAFPEGRVVVSCGVPRGEAFASAFEAMVRSIHFAR